MTEREMQKLVVINKVIDGTLTNNEAAQMLGLSVRQIFRLKKVDILGHQLSVCIGFMKLFAGLIPA